MRLPRPESFITVAPCLLVIFFVLKASVSGIWIVRPWDVPDEIGHFSYIKDLAVGNGIPVLDETKMDADAWSHFARNTDAAPDKNWIAQHPPLYHVLMVPVYWLGALFGSTLWGSFYLIRLATACLFGLGILVMVKAFRAAGLSASVSLGLGLIMASIPNHTYLAGAVNHDALVFLFGSLVLYYWVRFSKSSRNYDLTRLGIVLGLGGLVKYTFLVLLPPVVLLVGAVMWRDRKVSMNQVATFLGLTFVPILAWMLRNWILVGEGLPIDTSGFQSSHPLAVGWLEFGRSFPVLSIITRSYWGLLGWQGDGLLQVRWLQIYSIYQQAYSWPVVILLALTSFYLAKDSLKNQRYLSYGVCGVLVAVLGFVSIGWWEKELWFYLPLFFLGIAILGWRIAEGCCQIQSRSWGTIQMAEIGAVVVFFFFLIIHLSKVYAYSLPSGVLQGTFGRYYLPIVGFLFLGFFGKGLRSFPLRAPLVMGIAILYACVELYVWLHEAIPFFYVHA